MEDERALIEKAQAGDDSAFETLVHTYMSAVYTFMYRYAGSRDVAEDATQEAFIKAWRGLKRFDVSKPFKPWLFSIARNALFDIVRRRTPYTFSSLESTDERPGIEDALVDPEPLPDELFARASLAAELAHAIAKISPRDRAVLTLRYDNDLTFEAIAEIMQAPQNTIKSWHRRALIRLRDVLMSKGAPKPHV